MSRHSTTIQFGQFPHISPSWFCHDQTEGILICYEDAQIVISTYRRTSTVIALTKRITRTLVICLPTTSASQSFQLPFHFNLAGTQSLTLIHLLFDTPGDGPPTSLPTAIAPGSTAPYTQPPHAICAPPHPDSCPHRSLPSHTTMGCPTTRPRARRALLHVMSRTRH